MIDGAGQRDEPSPVDGRATRAEIDLDALHRNVEILRGTLTPGTEMMAVVKANAYGHGARMAAATALAAGAAWLGVATVSEGWQLRHADIQAPILVLSPISIGEVPAAIQARLELTVATPELLNALATASQRASEPVGVHVKIDTGMHRYGCEPELAVALAKQVAAIPTLRLAGLMTHFAAADEPDERPMRQQGATFVRCLDDLAAAGVEPERRHVANSAAAIRNPRYHLDLVRFGIAMYGLRPSPAIALPSGIRPVMTVRSSVARVHRLPAGSGVGYGFTYTADTDEQAILVPIGYADGYRRGLSNQGWMSVAGRRAMVAGRVSMDQTVVRLAAEAEAAIGDDIVVIGDGGDGAPTADQIAALVDTISYEIVSGISSRVPRHYVRDGRLVAVEDLSHGPQPVGGR